MQTIDFRWFLPFSIVLIVFVKTAENDMKTIQKRCVDAIQSLRISFSIGTIVVFSLKTKRIRVRPWLHGWVFI